MCCDIPLQRDLLQDIRNYSNNHNTKQNCFFLKASPVLRISPVPQGTLQTYMKRKKDHNNNLWILNYYPLWGLNPQH